MKQFIVRGRITKASFLCILLAHAIQSSVHASDAEDPYEHFAAKEMRVPPILVSPDKEVFAIDLGTHATSTQLKFSVALENHLNRDLLVKEVNSSCGCVLGYIPNVTVKPGEKTDIKVMFKLKTYPATIRQSLAIVCGEAADDEIQIRLLAKTELPFVFSSKQLQVEERPNDRHSVSFAVSHREGYAFDVDGLEIEPTTGYLSEIAKTPASEETVQFEALFDSRLVLQTNSVTENMRFRSPDGKVIGELPVTPRLKPRLQIRPASIMLAKDGTRGYRGVAVATGSREQIEDLVKGQLDVRLASEGSEVPWADVVAHVERRSDRMAILRVRVKCKADKDADFEECILAIDSPVFDGGHQMPVFVAR